MAADGRLSSNMDVSDSVDTKSDLWKAEVLAPLRANMACMQGRLHEQEEALARSAREQEHAAAKARKAERLTAERLTCARSLDKAAVRSCSIAVRRRPLDGNPSDSS